MKGVSQLVSATLLITFTIGMSVVIWHWTGPYTRGGIETAERGGEVILDCAVGDLQIEEVIVFRTTNTTNVRIKNSGSIPLNITEVFVYSDSMDYCELNSTKTLIEKRESVTFEGACSIFTDRCSNFKFAKVITSCSDVGATLRTKPTCYE